MTEPAVYGVSMSLKRPLAAVCIASGITGAFAGIMHLSAFSFATPSLVSFPQFIGAEGNNLILAIITGAIAIILSFVLTWILGFKDPVDESDETAQDNSNAGQLPKAEKESIVAPLSGEMFSLSKVNDETFSTEVLGKGAAILPSVGKVFAPFDGEVVTIFPTKHALGLKSNDGVELLIHVGLKTVSLEGKHFMSYVKDGQKIKKGDLLLEFDISAIKDAGYDIVTPIVISNSDDFSDIEIQFKDKVTAMEMMMEVK